MLTLPIPALDSSFTDAFRAGVSDSRTAKETAAATETVATGRLNPKYLAGRLLSSPCWCQCTAALDHCLVGG